MSFNPTGDSLRLAACVWAWLPAAPPTATTVSCCISLLWPASGARIASFKYLHALLTHTVPALSSWNRGHLPSPFTTSWGIFQLIELQKSWPESRVIFALISPSWVLCKYWLELEQITTDLARLEGWCKPISVCYLTRLKSLFAFFSNEILTFCELKRCGFIMYPRQNAPEVPTLVRCCWSSRLNYSTSRNNKGIVYQTKPSISRNNVMYVTPTFRQQTEQWRPDQMSS